MVIQINLENISIFSQNNETLFWNISNATFENSNKDAFQDDYIFDRLDVRVIFITLYSIVFSCCFFGNLLVILVVTLSRRLRSITNFFLANLAFADLCVGIFCVFQNLSMYLIPTWVLGDLLCKMYQFVHSLSYTASIFILIVICTERYFAIIHPITCKQILTPTRLRLVILAVWIISAVYSAPKFIFVQTIVNSMYNGESEIICVTHRMKYNSKVFDMINFVLLYVVPLAIMTVLYTRIAIGLWKSSKELEKHLSVSYSNQKQRHTDHTCFHVCNHQRHELPNNTRLKQQHHSTKFTMQNKPLTAVGAVGFSYPNSSQNVLRARRRVIRMLIIVVLTFALCNLPFHARKMWQYWSSGYCGSSDFSTLFTPLTFLITYFNSGINPLLYAFLSRNFRKGMREILLCSLHGSSHRRPPSHNCYNTTRQTKNEEHILLDRHASTKSTYKANTTITIMNVNSDDYSNDV